MRFQELQKRIFQARKDLKSVEYSLTLAQTYDKLDFDKVARLTTKKYQAKSTLMDLELEIREMIDSLRRSI